MQVRRIIHAIGFDFDGCLLPDDLNTEVKHHNARFLNALKKQNRLHYDASMFFLTTNRQSFGVNKHNLKALRDDLNASKQSSCFPTIKDIVEEFEGSSLSFALLADAYAERPNGYSYVRAILRDNDRDYHPEYLFDSYKASILYHKVHLAAKLARSCDFITCESVANPEELTKLPFQSNAAYVYLAQAQKLFYVNRVEKELRELPVNDKAMLDQFILKLNTKVSDEEHDFVALDRENNVLNGLTLRDAELDLMRNISGHYHTTKDYPIIFDSFDDQSRIQDDLNHTFQAKAQLALLPKNVTVRFYLYDANQPNKLEQQPLAVLQGTGDIDMNPKLTILRMAKELVGKPVLEEIDFDKPEDAANSFAQFIRNSQSAVFFKTRDVIKPTVSHKADEVSYAANLKQYGYSLPPDEVLAISVLIEKLSAERVQHFVFFPERKKAKVQLLQGLLGLSWNHDLEEVKSEVRRLMDGEPGLITLGRLSHRTEKLLNNLSRP